MQCNEVVKQESNNIEKSAWESDSDSNDEGDISLLTQKPASQSTEKRLEQEFDQKFCSWITYASNIDWRKEFPDIDIPQNLDGIDFALALAKADMGKLMSKVFAEERARVNKK